MDGVLDFLDFLRSYAFFALKSSLIFTVRAMLARY